MGGRGEGPSDASLEAENERLRDEVARLRQELDAERALHAAVMTHAPDFIVLCELDGRIRFTNRVVAGLHREDAIGAPVTRFAPPESEEAIREAIARVAATGEQVEIESFAPGDHGEPTHFLSRIAPVRDAVGRITSVVMFASDVGRLRAAEVAASDRDARLRVVLEASQVAVCEVDLDTGLVLDADQRFRGIAELGDLPTPLPLATVLQRAHPEDLPELVETIESLRTGGTYRVLEFRMVRTSGAIRWLRGTGKLRVDVPGARFVAGVEDVTDRKALELEAAQTLRLESIGRLAGGVAHDFNNLLTIVIGAATLLERRLEGRGPIPDEVAEIRRAAERGAALTGQLVAFARRQVIRPRVLSLSGLVADVQRLLVRVLGEDIAIVTACQATWRVRVDPHQLERVLINLAANARDAMPDGGTLTIETADVELDAVYVARHVDAVSGPYVMLAVTDTGDGMTPETIEHLFEPFFTTKEAGRGTGLGLATCYGIIRQAGGFIHVYSEPGLGTTFRIYLPRVDAALDRPSPSAPPARSTRGDETVLLVEDEAAIRHLVAVALRDLGYRVLDAGDAEQALAIAEGHEGPIHILVTDVVLPRMGGRGLAERFTALRPDAAVLFVSGYTRNAIVHQGVLHEGVEFLAKPYSPVELHERIRRILDQRR